MSRLAAEQARSFDASDIHSPYFPVHSVQTIVSFNFYA